MKEIGSLIFLYAETPLHAGSGTALGAVDLPIQRERMSNLPMVQGSGVKGAWREEVDALLRRDSLPKELTPVKEDRENFVQTLFGPPPPTAERVGTTEEADSRATPDEFAGALSLLDARLLLFPARTVWGGWAWVTAPMVLERLARDLELVRQKAGATSAPWGELSLKESEAVLVSTSSQVARQGTLLIEDLEYTARPSKEVDALATWLRDHAFPQSDAYRRFSARVEAQIVVLGDAEFRFLTEHATEVVARIRINSETGTVDAGALWSEESLPAESILWTVGFFSKSHRKVNNRREPSANGQKAAEAVKGYSAEALQRHFHDAVRALNRIRLGGDRTIGRGIMGVRAVEASDE